MKIFKQVNLNGSYINNSDKYQLLIHYSLTSSYHTLTLYDENGNTIEEIDQFSADLNYLAFPSISGTQNSSTGAITYNSFNVEAYNNFSNFKNALQKILIPPHFSLSGINAGLFIELDNLEELKGLI